MVSKPQHIVQLEIDNFKRLKAVHIDTGGKAIVPISGRNGQGKSSILDAIQAALGGKKNSPDAPIRKGERSATVVVTTDELVVKREFVGDKSFLTVTSRQGGRFNNPQEILDRLWNTLTFDPLVFMRMKAAEQRQALMSITGLDPADLDRQRAEAYEERRLVNRSVDSLKAQMVPLPADPGESVDLAGLMQRSSAHATERALRRGLDTQIVNLKAGLERMKAELADLTARIGRGEEELAQLEKRQATPMPAGPDEAELARAQQHNRDVDAYRAAKKAHEDRATRLAQEEAKASRLTTRINEIDDEKEAALKAARYPIEGLSLSDEGVLFNGLPLQQASQAEQLRVSTAIAIAMNSELRVMLVRDGSLLDSESLALLETMAREANAQVFIERVADAGHGVGVVIEDGEVVSAS